MEAKATEDVTAVPVTRNNAFRLEIECGETFSASPLCKLSTRSEVTEINVISTVSESSQPETWESVQGKFTTRNDGRLDSPLK